MTKLVIIEPWESGTPSAIDATIIKKSGRQFLLFTKSIINVRGKRAQYFVCELKNAIDQNAFDRGKKGVYPIQMVFDQNILTVDSFVPALNTYRSNFLLGEIEI